MTPKELNEIIPLNLTFHDAIFHRIFDSCNHVASQLYNRLKFDETVRIESIKNCYSILSWNSGTSDEQINRVTFGDLKLKDTYLEPIYPLIVPGENRDLQRKNQLIKFEKSCIEFQY